MLDRVIEDMRRGHITVLVVWKSSRIERRGAYNAFDLARRVREAGGRIEYVLDTYLNETNEMSDVMLALAATKDREESREKSERIRISFDRIDANGAIRNRAGYGPAMTRMCQSWAFALVLDAGAVADVSYSVTRRCHCVGPESIASASSQHQCRPSLQGAND